MTKKEELFAQIIELLQDEDIFNEACEELDNYNGFLGDDRYYSMFEFDDLYCSSSPLEIAELVCGGDFNPNDDFFKVTCYGCESSDSKDYSDYYDAEDVAEELGNYYPSLCLDAELTDLLEQWDEADDEDEDETDNTVYRIIYIVKTENGNETKTVATTGEKMKEFLAFLVIREEFKKIISVQEWGEDDSPTEAEKAI